MPWRNEAVRHTKNVIRESGVPKSLKESGFGLVSTAQNKFSRDNKIEEEPLKPFRKYILSYRGVPLIAAAIDRTVDFVVSPGFYVDSESIRAKKNIHEFIEKMNFDIFLRGVVKDMLLFGDSFVEIVGKKKNIEELKVLNPVNMRVIRDTTGEVTGYYQDLPNAKRNKNNPWKPEQIAHFIHNKIGDAAYGTSLVESLEKIIQIKVNMEDSMEKILKKHAGAPLHVKIGNTPDGWPATQADIDSMTSDLQALTNETNWVTTDLCDINAVDVGKKVIDIQPYAEHIDNQLVYGLQVPYVLLGRANISEGLASVQLEAMDRRAKSIQMLVSTQVEQKIFSKLVSGAGMTKSVYLRWGQPSQVTEQAELATYLEMMNGQMSPEFKEKIENEIAKMLQIEHKAKKGSFDNEAQGPFQQWKDKGVRTSKRGIDGNPDRRKEINLPKK